MNRTTTKTQRSTEQGRETPVPVGKSGVRTGHARPSSSDSPGPSVGHQAEEPRSATGSEGEKSRELGTGYSNTDSESSERVPGMEEGGFISSKLIRRTPVKEQRNTSQIMEEETTKLEKRKRTEESPKQMTKKRGKKDGGMGLPKPRENIMRVTGELEKMISAHVNTKVEIKNLVRDLAYYVKNMAREEESSDDREDDDLPDGKQAMHLQRRIEELERKWSELRQTNRKLEEENRGLKIQLREKRCDGEQKAGVSEDRVQPEGVTRMDRSGSSIEAERRSTGTQTLGRIQEQEKDRHRAKKEIRHILETNGDFEALETVMDLRWPDEVYERLKVIEGNPVWEGEETVKAIMVEKGNMMDKGIARQYALRFPELSQGTQEREGKGCEYFTYEIRVERASGLETSRIEVVKIPVEEKEEATYENIKIWKRRLEEKGINRVAVACATKGERMKKIMEWVFRGSGIEVLWYIPSNNPANAGRKQEATEGREPAPRKIERNTEALVVMVPGKRYTEILAEVKEKVRIDNVGVNVRTLRATRNGELLVTVEKGGDLEALSKEIERNIGGNVMALKEGGRQLTTVHIRGMDGNVNVRQVEEAIMEATGVKEGAVKIKDLRPAFSGTQNATVLAPRDIAVMLIDKGEIRIGWSRCKIQERVELRKCLRCWGFDHLARNCKGMDRSKLCLKCGKEGHKVGECQEAAYCPICNQGGHRADSTGCPLFRKAVAARRRDKDRLEPSRRDEAPRERREGQEMADLGGQRTDINND